MAVLYGKVRYNVDKSMSSSTLSRNTLLHSIQCVEAMSRLMEEYLATAMATDADRETFGELLMDFDSVIDNLTTVYEEARGGDERFPPSEELVGAFSQFLLTRRY
jgi:hypothetical protein